MRELNTQAIVATLKKNGIEVEEAAISKQMSDMMTIYRIDERAASSAIIKQHEKASGKKIVIESGNKVTATVNMLDGLLAEKKSWVDIKLKVMKLFPNKEPSIAQKGVAGDETGSVVFTTWKTANAPTLVEGETYNFENVVINPYSNNPQISVNKSSTLSIAAEKIEYVPETKEITGLVTGIAANSGLIRRCPECDIALNKGVCKEHGKQDGKYDLRLMLTLDDGKKTYKIVAKRELTEKLTRMSLDTAIAAAEEALSQAIVKEEQENQLEGKYIHATVMDMQSRYLNACEIELLGME